MDEPNDGSRAHIAEQLVAKTWDELCALEHAGYLLFPDKIYRRAVKGKFESRDVCIRVPREPDLRKARAAARKQFAEEGLNEQKDSDLFENLETMHILWAAIRNNTPPHEPLCLSPDELESIYDKRSLMQMWGKLDTYTQLLDPRPETIDDKELLFLVSAIAKERSIRPLRAFGSAAQAHFIVSTVEQLVSCLASKSSSEPSEP